MDPLEVPAELERACAPISRRAFASRIVTNDTSLLFHYTNADALIKIVRSGKLWATNFRFLNDLSEVRYGLDLANELLDSEIEGCNDEFRDRVRKSMNDSFSNGAVTPYVVSFCDRGDLLSQWRIYASQGAGISLALDRTKMSSVFDEARPMPITYNPEVQRQIVSESAREYGALLPSWPNHEEAIRMNLVSLLATEFAAFKHPAFSEEQEWRLMKLQPGTSEMCFRGGRLGVVPYIELEPVPGESLPIKKIVQGPTADRVSATSIRMLLDRCGYSKVTIEPSRIPLRGC